MIVKFGKPWRVPGFGRKRFPKGIVYDVPERLKERLPKDSVILPDDYNYENSQEAKDERALADLERVAAEQEAEINRRVAEELKARGVNAEEPKPVEEPPVVEKESLEDLEAAAKAAEAAAVRAKAKK